MDNEQEREVDKQLANKSGFVVRTDYFVHYSFDPQTGEGFREEGGHGKPTVRRDAHISELFG